MEDRRVIRQLVRWYREAQLSGSPDVVQPQVGEHDAVLRDLGRQQLAAAVTLLAAELEDVLEVGREAEVERERDREDVVIGDLDGLREGAADNPLAVDIDAPGGNRPSRGRPHGRVGEVVLGGVAVLGRGEEDDGADVPEGEVVDREVARVSLVEPVPLVVAGGQVPLRVAHQEEIAFLDDERLLDVGDRDVFTVREEAVLLVAVPGVRLRVNR